MWLGCPIVPCRSPLCFLSSWPPLCSFPMAFGHRAGNHVHIPTRTYLAHATVCAHMLQRRRRCAHVPQKVDRGPPDSCTYLCAHTRHIPPFARTYDVQLRDRREAVSNSKVALTRLRSRGYVRAARAEEMNNRRAEEMNTKETSPVYRLPERRPRRCSFGAEGATKCCVHGALWAQLFRGHGTRSPFPR